MQEAGVGRGEAAEICGAEAESEGGKAKAERHLGRGAVDWQAAQRTCAFLDSVNDPAHSA